MAFRQRPSKLSLSAVELPIPVVDIPDDKPVYSPKGLLVDPFALPKMVLIGRGSFGDVMKVPLRDPARDIEDVIAIKQIQIGRQLNEEKARAQLMRELEVLRDGHCPFIVKYYGFFLREATLSLCMEYMDGGSWNDLIARPNSRIPEQVLGKLACAVVQGLWYLEKFHNIIHRDVKPGNILVNREGEIKVCDFGISGKLENGVVRTNVGTVVYMCPERLDGSQSAYGVESDVWSLGITLVELANGVHPYHGSPSVMETFRRIKEDDPPLLSTDSFSPEFCDFVSQCLRKQPSERYNYEQLKNHPFFLKYENATVDVASWVCSVLGGDCCWKETRTP